jgi:hypothetical protein
MSFAMVFAIFAFFAVQMTHQAPSTDTALAERTIRQDRSNVP